MKNHGAQMWKASLAKLLVAVMVMLSVLVIPSTTTNATTAPTLSKTVKNVLVKETFNLSVTNKVAKSKYTWATSNKKIATVNTVGQVTAVKYGNATITCTVKAPNKTYKLTCKVTVIKPALVFRIKDKVTVMNVGQDYTISKVYAPSSSNDFITWTSSDPSIAAPDKDGKIKPLKEGTVTITGRTFTGKKDSMTFLVIDKDGLVATQKELDALLGTGVGLITLKTDAVINFTIAAGDYSKTKLVVSAPNADVHNYGEFAAIDIQKIAKNSWYEEAIGNLLNVIASDARIVVGENSIVRIEVTTAGVTLRIENNGLVEQLTLDKPSDVNVSGTSKDSIPVTINNPKVVLTSSVPLALDCTEKFQLVLLKGAEGTTVQATTKEVSPVITGDVKVDVKIVPKVATPTLAPGVSPTPTPKPTPRPTKTPTATPAPTATPVPNNGGGGGSYTPPVDTPKKTVTLSYGISDITKVDNQFDDITAITATYNGSNYDVGKTVIDTLRQIVIDLAPRWNAITSESYTQGGQTVNIVATAVSNTKALTFVNDSVFKGRTYAVTVNDKSVIVSTDITNVSFDQLTSLDVTYAGNNYDVGSSFLILMTAALDGDAFASKLWNDISDGPQTIKGQDVVVTNTNGGNTKTVTFKSGKLKDKSFAFTLGADGSASVKYNNVDIFSIH